MSDEWRIPDQAAAFLFADRDICRRVFHREPLDQVVAVIDWVLSEQDSLGPDLEGTLTRWAIEHEAGVYGPNRRQGNLEQVWEIVSREISQGTLSWFETKNPRLTHAEKYRIYLKRLHDREKSLRRRLTPSELNQFTRSFYSADYRKELEKVSPEQWDEIRAELEGKDFSSS